MKKRDRSSPGAQHLVRNCVRYCFNLMLLLLFVGTVTSCVTPFPAPVLSRSSQSTSPDSLSRQQRLRRRPAYYKVKGGDTLSTIAQRFGLNYKVLAEWNQLRKPYTIYPGHRLILVKPKQGAVSKTVPHKRAVLPKKKQAINEQKAVHRAQAQRTSSEKHTKSPLTSSQKKGNLQWQWPTRGDISQHFVKGDSTRKGIVIAGSLGQKVVAAESGKVVYAGNGLIGYGLLIIIKHDKDYLSAYGYNRKINVREGDQIDKGEAIAEMGTKGNSSAVLHFEIRYNGLPVDPLKVLPP